MLFTLNFIGPAGDKMLGRRYSQFMIFRRNVTNYANAFDRFWSNPYMYIPLVRVHYHGNHSHTTHEVIPSTSSGGSNSNTTDHSKERHERVFYYHRSKKNPVGQRYLHPHHAFLRTMRLGPADVRDVSDEVCTIYTLCPVYNII